MGVSCIYAKQTLTIPKKVCYFFLQNSNSGMLLSTLCTVCDGFISDFLFSTEKKHCLDILDISHKQNCEFHCLFPVILECAKFFCSLIYIVKLETRFQDIGFGMHKDRTHCLTFEAIIDWTIYSIFIY